MLDIDPDDRYELMAEARAHRRWLRRTSLDPRDPDYPDYPDEDDDDEPTTH